MLSYLVRITVHDPRENDPDWRQPTNTDMEFAISDVVYAEFKSTLPEGHNGSGLSVSVSSERLDK